jgi:hypothetical protein
MGPWAWIKVIANNRKTIFNLAKEGFLGKGDVLRGIPERSSRRNSTSAAD